MEATLIQHRRRMLEVTGSARVLNISSNGLAFRTELKLQVAETVTLILEWPASLEDGCPLRLRTSARVLRIEPDGVVAVSILGHEICTGGRKTRRVEQA